MPAAGKGEGDVFMFVVSSAGANELSVYWPNIRTTKKQSTADRRILFNNKCLLQERAGRPLRSIERFSSYTPRRMS
jgi:hypothetical protein